MNIPVYQKQADFLQSTARFRSFCGGRGCGKSQVGALDIWTRSLKAEGRNRLYLVGAPTYGGLHDYTIRSFKEAGQKFGLWEESRFRGSAPGPLYKAAHAEFIFRSADNPERFRGPNLGGMWLDEASQYEQEAYDNAIACVRDGDYLGGVTATFTPKGLTHWTYDVFGKPGPEKFLVTATSKDNPFLSPKFYEDLLAQYGERSRQARQELGGEFLDAEGAEWPSDYFGPHIWFDEWPRTTDAKFPALTLKTIAVDPSKGSQDRTGDYSAIVWGGRGRDGTLWIDADLDNVRSAEGIIDAVMERGAAFVPDVLAIESNAYQHLLATTIAEKSRLSGVMLPVAQVHNRINKQERIRRVGPYLERKNLRFKTNSRGAKLLVDQLRDFPVAEHDDGPDGLEMMIRCMIELQAGRGRQPNARVLV